jgi:N6-L-threonylcarbamoyladenine synthase
MLTSRNGLLKIPAPLRTMQRCEVKNKPMKILGIETSCDETSAAIVSDGAVLSNVISSQFVHAHYGGVVPELASRAHQRLIVEVVDQSLRQSRTSLEEIDGVASTYGPGLVGALLVGLNFAKGLAYARKVPFVGVNHMEGHLFSNFLTDHAPEYPFLCLIVSGGHTMLVLAKAPLEYTLLGETRDDAAGEAFDKVAKMLGLGYPGGPAIDRMAAEGNPDAVQLPRSFLEEGSLDFSFSGIKTAVLYLLRREGVGEKGAACRTLPRNRLADICASFQASVVDVLVKKTMIAADRTHVNHIAVAGGVSANSSLRKTLQEEAKLLGKSLFLPPMEYCMDNGAMIAYAGYQRLLRGFSSSFELPAMAALSMSDGMPS